LKQREFDAWQQSPFIRLTNRIKFIQKKCAEDAEHWHEEKQGCYMTNQKSKFCTIIE
jgi:hypothetical protein